MHVLRELVMTVLTNVGCCGVRPWISLLWCVVVSPCPSNDCIHAHMESAAIFQLADGGAPCRTSDADVVAPDHALRCWIERGTDGTNDNFVACEFCTKLSKLINLSKMSKAHSVSDKFKKCGGQDMAMPSRRRCSQRHEKSTEHTECNLLDDSELLNSECGNCLQVVSAWTQLFTCCLSSDARISRSEDAFASVKVPNTIHHACSHQHSRCSCGRWDFSGSATPPWTRKRI